MNLHVLITPEHPTLTDFNIDFELEEGTHSLAFLRESLVSYVKEQKKGPVKIRSLRRSFLIGSIERVSQ